MKVVWTENAEFDLDDLYDFVAKDSPIYAEQFVDQILREVGRLEQTPRMGRKVPEANSDQIRERIVHSQRVIYLIDEGNAVVNILALLHVRRDLENDEVKPWS